MNRQNSDRFEQQWADAFEGASMEPSAHTWDKIELSVVRSDNRHTRRRLLFYKLLAAASISFIALTGVWLTTSEYLRLESNPAAPSPVASANRPSTERTVDTAASKECPERYDSEKPGFDQPLLAQLPAGTAETERSSKYGNHKTVRKDRWKTTRMTDRNNRTRTVPSPAYNTIREETDDPGHQPNLSAPEKRASLTYSLHLTPAPPHTEITPQRVPQATYQATYATAESPRKNRDHPRALWAGLGISAGNYHPGDGDFLTYHDPKTPPIGKSSVPATALNAPTVTESEEASPSFSIGVNLGANLTDKLALTSSINFMQQNTTYRSDITYHNRYISVAPGSGGTLEGPPKVRSSESYTISDTYQALSVPIQAGYYLTDQRFGILLLAGFTNDFFLKRRISEDGESGVFNTADTGQTLYTIGGIAGARFSYTIGSHYTIAVQPQYRRSIDSFALSGNKSSALEVSFKLNYLLRGRKIRAR